MSTVSFFLSRPNGFKRRLLGACFLLSAVTAHADSVPPTNCLTGHDPEPARVSKISDGDTLVLANGQRVRIIGINTLELNADSQASRALAREATDTLRGLIGNRDIVLIDGLETHDRHGRRLAHVLNDQGQNVASELIRRGHATAIAVAENTRCAEHHFALEAIAREAELGIWEQPSEWFVDEDKPVRDRRGFKLMQTTITSINQDGPHSNIRFSNGIRATLGKYWPGPPPENELIGKSVEIRGWISGKRNKPKLTLHHPLNIRILSD